MYVPVHKPQPSRQARELGDRIAGLVQSYLAENPGASGNDVMQAFEVAQSMLPAADGGAARRARLLIAIAIGLLMFGVLAALFMARGL
jgi:hypothetical protein